MPPQRTPLAPKSLNLIPRKHISLYLRAKIAGKAEVGVRPAELAQEYSLEYSTVWRTIQLDLKRYEGESLPKAPRKKSYIEAEERLLLRYIRLNPKDIYAEVKRAYGLACSRSTIKKFWTSMEYTIGELNAARFLQRRTRLSVLLSV